MRRPEVGIGSVYLHRAPIDMRKQMNGLAALVTGAMQQNPFSDSLFVFINRKRDKLKLLLWDRSGFIVWYKRLEQEKFHWPVRINDAVVTLTCEQLHWLLDGYDVWRMQPHKTLSFTAVC
jgi:transposase